MPHTNAQPQGPFGAPPSAPEPKAPAGTPPT